MFQQQFFHVNLSEPVPLSPLPTVIIKKNLRISSSAPFPSSNRKRQGTEENWRCQKLQPKKLSVIWAICDKKSIQCARNFCHNLTGHTSALAAI